MLFQRLAGNDIFRALREMQRLQDLLNRVLSASGIQISVKNGVLMLVLPKSKRAIVREDQCAG